jgi:hypothetical protein
MHGMTRNEGLRRILMGTAAILLVPLVAMRFTREVNWGLLDFAVAVVGVFGSPIAGS